MIIYKDNLKELHGFLEGGINAVDEISSKKAIDYKTEVCKNYINLSPELMDIKLGGSVFYITRKYDGEMNVIFLDGDEALLINRSGRVRMNIPCIENAKACLKKAGINQAVIPAELYVDESDGRTRVFDVLNVLADEKRIGALRLAVFDILEINGEVFKAGSYEETYNEIKRIFDGAEMCNPVVFEKGSSKSDVKSKFKKWVEDEGSEGLVVRTELPLVYKIKPRYTIDVAVVGYSEGIGDTKGQVRSLLLAMMPEEGVFQIIGKTGNGFDENFKKELLPKLEPLIINSQYIETDSNHVAFHMIKPEMVIELMINDVLFDTSTGYIYNPVLGLEDDTYYRRAQVKGISVVYPIFVRFRDDKKPVFEDVRLSQINDFSYVEIAELDSMTESAQKSELLKRVVYKKEAGSKLMVQKFMVWKTNKEDMGYPSYVFHYTNFSSERKEALQREVCISNDENQIMELFEASMLSNVKKGWVQV